LHRWTTDERTKTFEVFSGRARTMSMKAIAMVIALLVEPAASFTIGRPLIKALSSCSLRLSMPYGLPMSDDEQRVRDMMRECLVDAENADEQMECMSDVASVPLPFLLYGLPMMSDDEQSVRDMVRECLVDAENADEQMECMTDIGSDSSGPAVRDGPAKVPTITKKLLLCLLGVDITDLARECLVDAESADEQADCMLDVPT
jgi:hypothetical protein